MTESTNQSELKKVATRCVPLQEPEITINDTNFFLAHVFAHGELEDINIINRHFDKETLVQALKTPHPVSLTPAHGPTGT